MDLDRAVARIDEQIAEANEGSPANFDDWHNKTEVVIRAIFGELSPTHHKFDDVRYSPSMWTENTDFRPYRRAGVQEVISILKASKLELELIAESASPLLSAEAPGEPSTRLFIVHGQNDAKKYELESYLQKLTGEAPIILHQQPNGGRVLIEKLEDNAESVGYAVVLLTADDRGRPAVLEPQDERPRARQNVVFEMGFFIGLIGRAHVAVLYEEGVELPSDINGLVYIPLDNAGAWKGKLASEIDHSGITVDWTAIGRS
ncbi:nucleotide-binding protein [Diaminobutyricibacter tongyongensis]|uniref:Nucleotide-binding protein n=1 Tax=Leifsonia tongyongensis TaxID=1268043 RepID=A0A6L9Y301_9MICO|nr:nucleotide-binding protein [Diaminobutyricibacter tongyongensis]NEN08039.1 nucleotide-binding protein [Diaminobutyricibacter tongyongensis]